MKKKVSKKKKTDLRISLYIYKIHKILALIKNHLNYHKINTFKFFFKKYNKLLFFKQLIFLHYIMMKNPKPEEEKIIKDIRNLFRLKKETKEIKYMVLRNIKNLFEYEKEE